MASMAPQPNPMARSSTHHPSRGRTRRHSTAPGKTWVTSTTNVAVRAALAGNPAWTAQSGNSARTARVSHNEACDRAGVFTSACSSTATAMLVPHLRARLLLFRIVSNTDSPQGRATYRKGYFETRLAPNSNRGAVWTHICDYLRRWVPVTRSSSWGPGGATSPTTSGPGGSWRWTWTRRSAAPRRPGCRPRWVTAPTCPGSPTVSSTWSSPPTCSSTSSGRRVRAAGRIREGARARRSADPAAAELQVEPGRLLRRLHPRRDLHRPVAAGLPGLAGVADRAEVPAIPAADHEEQGLGADVPGALVPPFARQTAGRPDAGHRHAGARASRHPGSDHVER